MDWQELEGTAKVGVKWRTAEQRGAKAWDGTVQGSAHPMQDRLAGATQGHSAGSLFGFH